MFNTAEHIQKLRDEQTKHNQTRLQYDEFLKSLVQKVICETRLTSQINGKAEYPWREGNALYLVGSEGCAAL